MIGLDFAQEMLDDAAARQSAQSSNLRQSRANIEWVQGDAMQLPFPDSSFDGATMGYGLRNVPDVLKALQVRYLTLSAISCCLPWAIRPSVQHLDRASTGIFIALVVT